MFQNRQTPEALKQAFNKIKISNIIEAGLRKLSLEKMWETLSESLK
ncbi:10346_t:CDS:1, partial [Racocetra fulgida]